MMSDDRTTLTSRRSRHVDLAELPSSAVRDISAAPGGLLAVVFASYLKTKNFHWYMHGPHSANTTCCWTDRRVTARWARDGSSGSDEAKAAAVKDTSIGSAM